MDNGGKTLYDMSTEVLYALAAFDHDLFSFSDAREALAVRYPDAWQHVEAGLIKLMLEKLAWLHAQFGAMETLEQWHDRAMDAIAKINVIDPSLLAFVLMTYALNLAALGNHGLAPWNRYMAILDAKADALATV